MKSLFFVCEMIMERVQKWAKFLCWLLGVNTNSVCQVQVEVIQKRQKEKKAMMTAVKKYQKGGFLTCLVKMTDGFHCTLKVLGHTLYILLPKFGCLIMFDNVWFKLSDLHSQEWQTNWISWKATRRRVKTLLRSQRKSRTRRGKMSSVRYTLQS